MTDSAFLKRCLDDTIRGVREGLSRFSGHSRVALIYACSRKDSPTIIDPQHLLRGHEVKLNAIYNSDNRWCLPSHARGRARYSHLEEQLDPQLDGIICQGGSTGTFYYQMWFTDHHPDLCSLEPTEYWLRHAILRLSHDIANDRHLYTGVSGKFLREYASHAIEGCLADKALAVFGMELSPYISRILEAILAISRTNEEGQRPWGQLTFIHPRELNRVHFLSRFGGPTLPQLANRKHVRKLLQAVERNGNVLVSDGTSILGIAAPPGECFDLSAEFVGRQGYLRVDGELICSFRDGNYSSHTFRARLFEVEETLLDFDLQPDERQSIFTTIAELVHRAEESGFGCSLVVDLAPDVESLAGQLLDPPLNLRKSRNLALAAALAKVDGALHLKADLHLYGFACLLDGPRVHGENRARGARYNSALRFTAHHPQTMIIVVSSDTTVSVFHRGEELHRRAWLRSSTQDRSLEEIPLIDWLEEENS